MDYCDSDDHIVALIKNSIPDLISVYKTEANKGILSTSTMSLDEKDPKLLSILNDPQVPQKNDTEKVADVNIAFLNTVIKPNSYIQTEDGKVFSPEAAIERYINGVKYFQKDFSLVDVTNLGFWRATSQKSSAPVKNIYDDNPTTYWQSDGVLPHVIEIDFSKRMEISIMALFFSYSLDESYSPFELSVYAGHNSFDMTHLKTLEMENVNGWVLLKFNNNRLGDNLLKCKYAKFTIKSNHQNGKDAHLRGIKFLSPRHNEYTDMIVEAPYSSFKLQSEAFIR
ncbi:uncharacterized protein SCODWIG_01754 [Saccharomycodes ludwigii]|uniref:DOC domain-containing protein n=1 Tax=Saccharomycodes ludwigii TaxID=36035 RepID=A0A376B5Q1_9ASCO|nr:uncharacterized protein SCODWIG_01754 [Saccharomycodes ludwigii]